MEYSPILFQYFSSTRLMKAHTNIGEGNGNPLQNSCLENPTGGAWWASVHGVMKSWTRLSDFTFTFHFHTLDKEMATHSSVLAWRIPGTGEPGGLPSMGSHRVRHDWSDLAAAAATHKYTHVIPHIPDMCFFSCILVEPGMLWHHPGLTYITGRNTCEL